jgi:hypothetical protein
MYSGLWRLSASTFRIHPENGGSKALRNAGIVPHHYTASHPRRPWVTWYMILCLSKSIYLHCVLIYFRGKIPCIFLGAYRLGKFKYRDGRLESYSGRRLCLFFLCLLSFCIGSYNAIGWSPRPRSPTKYLKVSLAYPEIILKRKRQEDLIHDRWKINILRTIKLFGITRIWHQIHLELSYTFVQKLAWAVIRLIIKSEYSKHPTLGPIILYISSVSS